MFFYQKKNFVFDISGINFAILRLCLPFTVHSLSWDVQDIVLIMWQHINIDFQKLQKLDCKIKNK